VKIIIIGDVHGEFARLNVIINKHKPDVILACGDFGYWPKFRSQEIKPGNTKIYFCDGNHEDHHSLIDLMEYVRDKPIPIQKNVFYMPRGTVLEIDNKKILFIGGAESIDKEYRIPGKTWFPEESITQEDLDKLPDIKPDIIISHTCPAFVMEEMNMTYWGDKSPDEQSPTLLNKVYEKYKPARWYYGHFHQEFRYLKDNTQFVGLDMLPNPGAWVELI
jgi:hypothetical protein